MAKQKFIYIQDGNNDALCWPVAQFLGFTHAADTTLLMKFQAQTNSDAATEIDQITLTIASNSEKAVMESIINAINDAFFCFFSNASNVCFNTRKNKGIRANQSRRLAKLMAAKKNNTDVANGLGLR